MTVVFRERPRRLHDPDDHRFYRFGLDRFGLDKLSPPPKGPTDATRCCRLGEKPPLARGKSSMVVVRVQEAPPFHAFRPQPK